MKKWLMLVLLVVLSGCGFHLRGLSADDESRLPYHVWAVNGGSSELKDALENVLHRQPKVLVSDTNPDVVIKVLSASETQDVSAVNLAGHTSEYILTLAANVQAYRHNVPLGNPMYIEVQRYMDYADNEILGKQNEATQIWQGMRTDAAEQIVHRLAHLPVTE